MTQAAKLTETITKLEIKVAQLTTATPRDYKKLSRQEKLLSKARAALYDATTDGATKDDGQPTL
jgi:hypothetical protein